MRYAIATFRRSATFPSQAIAAPESVQGIDFSDQYDFWKQGYPAIMITDTAFHRYPHYHRATDTPEKVMYDQLAQVVNGLATVVGDLCCKDYLPEF